MIAGIGTDLVEIERMKKACEKEAFLLRVFTEEERRQAGSRISRLAGDFAVKEAVSKTLGTGFRSFEPRDIEVLRSELGKPYIRLYGGAERLARELGICRFHVSITNTAQHALAYVVGEGRECSETDFDWKTDEGN